MSRKESVGREMFERDPSTRREFFVKLSLGLGAFAAVITAIPFVGVLVSPLIRRPEEIWRSVGAVDEFEIGKTIAVSFTDASPLPWAGITAKTAAYVRRVGKEEFVAFSINCTHLGCPVRWLANPELFMCPCHGGVYYENGVVAAGPPPKPLPRYPLRIRNGKVEIQTSPVPISS